MSLPSGRLIFAKSISLRQFQKYLSRYTLFHPTTTRTHPPAKTIRAPTTPGTGIFFYPPDSSTKTSAYAAGPLGDTSETIHPSRFEICRPVAAKDEKEQPVLKYWGIGGAVQVTKNLLSGVAEGFAIDLELHGVGYRAEEDKERNKLVLRLGLSHTVEFDLEERGCMLRTLGPQVVQVAGVNRADVHQMAATIRAVRKPEVYKGKGIRYKNEPVRRKEAKKD